MNRPRIIEARATMAALDAAPFAALVTKPWGWELHWTPADSPYVGKIIHINAGARLSLQVHEAKCESWLLIRGRATVIWDNALGQLEEVPLKQGVGYTCDSGKRHRLVGVTDCDIVEVSTPECGTTWRLEDDFGRPHETDQQRRKERLAASVLHLDTPVEATHPQR